MSTDGNILGQLILILFLTLLNAFFAGSEIAMLSVNKKKIRLKAESGDEKAEMLLGILKEPSRFLSTIQVGITFAGLFSSASAAVGISDDLGRFLSSIGIPFGKDVAFVGVTLILSYIILVFGELVPKRLALQNSEKFAMLSVKIINVFSKLMQPFVIFLSFSTNGILRLFGFDPKVEEKVTIEEIKSLINVGQEQGVIDPVERDMIASVISFDNKMAEEVMTARTEVFMLDIDNPFEDNLEKMLDLKHSRIPIYKKNVDNIVGVLYLKDYLLYAYKSGFKDIDIKKIMRPAYFVPEHKNVNDLFLEMQKTRNHFAILIDEYGGFSGIVTMEDLIEEIVGDIEDEYDRDEPEIEKIDKNIYHTKGSISIKELNNKLDLKLNENSEYYDTLGGLLIYLLGYIPIEDETKKLRYKNIELQILEIKRRRIHKVKITLLKDKKD